MLVVNLRCGLGNQMFQYALARTLAFRRRQPVFLDASSLGHARPGETVRTCGLHVFNIDLPLIQADDFSREIALSRVVCHVRECVLGFESSVLDSHSIPLVVFDGFWQCERYFSEIAPLIRSDFILREPLPAGIPCLDQIGSTSSVCVHVRRQDYVTGSGAHLGFVGIEYYRKAIAEMVERVPNAHFLIFSDDLPWCAESLSIQHRHSFVDYDAGPSGAGVVLSIMSRCNHFIISNSTFSWWAAWLGAAPDKIVIAPAAWFAAERDTTAPNRHLFDSRDIVPVPWIRL